MNTGSPDSTAIIAITRRGVGVGRRLRERLPGSDIFLPEKFSPAAGEKAFALPVRDIIGNIFTRYRHLVLIMATGAAVRLVAPHLRDKHKDPGVVAVDDAGSFAVSLLSGHIGGGNEMARRVASILGAAPVVTTASDMGGMIAVDLLGREFGWQIEDGSDVTAVSAALVNGEAVGVYQDVGEKEWQAGPLPRNLRVFTNLPSLLDAGLSAVLLITDRTLDTTPGTAVVYRPRSLVVGIGCNRGTKAAVIEEAVSSVFAANGLSLQSIRNLATIDLKKDESGLLEFARKHWLPISYFDKEALKRAECPSHPSPAALKYTGAPAVCEAAALLSSGSPTLVVPKQRFKGAVTVAVARLPAENREKKGKLFLVGIGPGDLKQMTFSAREALDKSDVVVGYDAYVRLIQPILCGKEVIATGMGAEVKRARTALALARQGRKVAVISSGDAGIYGMAGLLGEILKHQAGDPPDIEVVPGVTSLVAAAALLGTPVTVDFASISLSDHLVSWEGIARRLALAAQGDFVIALYNPRSKRRRDQLARAREIILKYRPLSTRVGIVTNAFREGQQVTITDLDHMLDCEVGMNTTVIIGNSTTFNVNGWMVTPRGYSNKYDLGDEA